MEERGGGTLTLQKFPHNTQSTNPQVTCKYDRIEETFFAPTKWKAASCKLRVRFSRMKYYGVQVKESEGIRL